jgi:hypothetical protein
MVAAVSTRSRDDMANDDTPALHRLLDGLGAFRGLTESLDFETLLTPATFQSRLLGTMNQAIPIGTHDPVPPELAEPFLTAEFRAKVKTALLPLADAMEREGTAEEPRYRDVERLVLDADACVPYSPLLAFLEMHPREDWYSGPARVRTLEEFFSTDVGPLSHLRRMAEPVDLLDAAQKSTGELRARCLVRALREVAEMLYVPYLRLVWMLTCCARGEWPAFPSDFGALVNQVQIRVGATSPGLVEPRAATFRNAASHVHWFYEPATDSVVLWDRKRPRTTLKTEALSETVIKPMFRIAAGTVLKLSVSYFVRRVVFDARLLDHVEDFAPACVDYGPEKKKAAEEAFERWKGTTFAALLEFVRAKGPPKTTGSNGADQQP